MPVNTKSIYLLLLLSPIFFFTSCMDNSKRSGIPDVALRPSDTFYIQKMVDTTRGLLEKSMERGQLIYEDFCMQCHLPSGEGVPGSFPPLAQSDWLKLKREASLRAVKFGQEGKITVNGVSYNGVMVPMGLSDTEIADVMNFVMNSWGNTQDQMVTPEEVEAVTKISANGSN